MAEFLDLDALESFSVEEFVGRKPYAWAVLDRVLLPDAFVALSADFPPLSLFAWHAGQARLHNQRPHDRWYLALDASPYPNYDGVVKASDLPLVWREFIRELDSSTPYRNLIAACCGRHHLPG